jgi:glycosyltransferase involved in cell wall biosynthesis
MEIIRQVKVRVNRAGTVRVNAGSAQGYSGKSVVGRRVTFRVNRHGVPELQLPGVSVITCTNRTDSLDRIMANYLRQVYPRKELVIIVNSNHVNISEWQNRVADHPDIRIFHVDAEKRLGFCLNYAVDQSAYEYIAKFDDDDYYAPNYLKSALDIFPSIHAGIVGKCAMFVYFEASGTLAISLPNHENVYEDGVAGATMIIRREVFNQVRFPDLTEGEDSMFLGKCREAGIAIYATDRFNFVAIRRSDVESHTWKVDETEYLKYCELVTKTNDYVPYITR